MEGSVPDRGRTYPVQLGATFASPSPGHTAFATVQCTRALAFSRAHRPLHSCVLRGADEFRPQSVDATRPGMITLCANNHVSVELPNQPGASSGDGVAFQGVRETAKAEALLIFERTSTRPCSVVPHAASCAVAAATQSFRLERLSTMVKNLRHHRTRQRPASELVEISGCVVVCTLFAHPHATCVATYAGGRSNVASSAQPLRPRHDPAARGRRATSAKAPSPRRPWCALAAMRPSMRRAPDRAPRLASRRRGAARIAKRRRRRSQERHRMQLRQRQVQVQQRQLKRQWRRRPQGVRRRRHLGRTARKWCRPQPRHRLPHDQDPCLSRARLVRTRDGCCATSTHVCNARAQSRTCLEATAKGDEKVHTVTLYMENNPAARAMPVSTHVSMGAAAAAAAGAEGWLATASS